VQKALAAQTTELTLARKRSNLRRAAEHERAITAERSAASLQLRRLRSKATLNASLVAMVEGIRLRKFSESAAKPPDARWAALNAARTQIGWCKAKYADARRFTTTVRVDDVLAVFFGPCTPAFLREDCWLQRAPQGRAVAPWRCFSFRVKGRTYDFITEDESGDDAITWVLGLQRLAAKNIPRSRRRTRSQLVLRRADMRVARQAAASGVPHNKVKMEAMFGTEISRKATNRVLARRRMAGGK
jgi:hypothetical protein